MAESGKVPAQPAVVMIASMSGLFRTKAKAVIGAGHVAKREIIFNS